MGIQIAMDAWIVMLAAVTPREQGRERGGGSPEDAGALIRGYADQ